MCLLGLSDSGKTLLFLQVGILYNAHHHTPLGFFFSQLKFGTYGQTQNSIVENVQQYEPSDVKVLWGRSQ